MRDFTATQILDLPPGSVIHVHSHDDGDTITCDTRGVWRFQNGVPFPPDTAPLDHDYLVHVGVPGDLPYDPTDDEIIAITYLRQHHPEAADAIERGEHRK